MSEMGYVKGWKSFGVEELLRVECLVRCEDVLPEICLIEKMRRDLEASKLLLHIDVVDD
jgi:hypothetical protein